MSKCHLLGVQRSVTGCAQSGAAGWSSPDKPRLFPVRVLRTLEAGRVDERSASSRCGSQRHACGSAAGDTWFNVLKSAVLRKRV